MKISFVILCYRSEKTLGGVAEEIMAVVARGLAFAKNIGQNDALMSEFLR